MTVLVEKNECRVPGIQICGGGVRVGRRCEPMNPGSDGNTVIAHARHLFEVDCRRSRQEVRDVGAVDKEDNDEN